MTDLAIGRLSAAVPAAPDDPDRGPRVRRLLGRVANHRLDTALRAVTLPPGDWCVRRVDLTLPVDLDRPDPAIEAQWARALADALRAALAGGSPDVVHFQRVGEALADLVASVARGQLQREWAWTQLGLLRAGDPPLGSAGPAAVLAALRRHPESALVAVAAAMRVAGGAAVHRLLGTRGWVELAAIVLATVTHAEVTVMLGPGMLGPAREPGATPAAPGGATAQVSDPQISALVATLIGRASLAVEFRRSRIRPDPQTARAWAVLVAAQADPAVLRRSTARAIITDLATRLGGPDPAPPIGYHTDTRAPTSQIGTPSRHAQGNPGVQPAAATRELDAPTADTQATSDQRWPTPWAGLLFLLSTAEQAGIPDQLLTDPVLESRPLWWVLHAMATRLVPATPDDPAVLALAGLLPGDEPDAQQPSAAEATQLTQHARRWAAVTAARLDRSDEDPVAVVTEVALRRGEVLAEPGWIEVYLRHDEVDIDVRRAALDADPGWVRWLGSVVRFVYE